MTIPAPRDPKEQPHPGDRFRCKNGAEFEATGAVLSIVKSGKATPCLYVDRIDVFSRPSKTPTFSLENSFRNEASLAPVANEAINELLKWLGLEELPLDVAHSKIGKISEPNVFTVWVPSIIDQQ